MATSDKPSGSESAQAGRDQAAETDRKHDTAGRSHADSDRSGGGMRGTVRNAVSATEDVSSGVVGGVANIAGGIVGVVANTANTAIDGVGSVGENVIHTAADLLTQLVGGVRQVAGAAVSGMPWNGKSGREQEAFRREPAPRRETAAEASMH